MTCLGLDGNTYTETAAGFHGALGPAVFSGGSWHVTSTDFAQYSAGSSVPPSKYPSAGLDCNQGGGGACGGTFGSGGVDYITGGIVEHYWLTVVGAGTLTIHTRSHPGGTGGSCGTSGTITAAAYVSGGLGGLVASDAQAAGTDLTLTIPDDGNCVHYVDLHGATGPWGYAGADWLPDDTTLVADFSSATTDPLTIVFTDESTGGTGTIDTWAWDFGDGSTSTSQNPTHLYAAAGVYEVILSIETDDSETATVTRSVTVAPDYTAPVPGGAIVEIRAAAVGAARWGVAHWGADVWAVAGWVDVTPQSVDALIRWGSHSPEAGILTETEPASWIVDTYDPDRLLDPGNTDSPYHADLTAGLPIRIRHRGTIVRQGVAETIAYFYADKVGALRVTDNVSIMARTQVPADSELSDTLRARARDAIAAAGLRITVADNPHETDPPVAPRLEGDRSVWRHIADAAQQVLYVPWVDAVGVLRFRPWANPYDRARGVDGTMLLDLGTINASAGLYSVVSAKQTVGDGGAVVERRLTPTPRYGAVAYRRADPTPDADTWAETVLADRSLQTVQWIPGEIYPLTADDVETFATMQSVERFGVQHDDVTPPVDITGIVVGGEIRVTSKKDSEARWRFTFELAQTADAPLYFNADPPQFMLNDPGDGYLYGD